jgi:Putative amidoligase enzyme
MPIVNILEVDEVLGEDPIAPDVYQQAFEEVLAIAPSPGGSSISTRKPKEHIKGSIGEALNKESPKLLYPPSMAALQYKVIDHSYIGIEIEIENIVCPIDDLIYWIRKPDGSLRDNGWEYVSHPIKGDDISYALSELKQNLEPENDPVFSGRTSVHVHMNVLDMSVDQLRSLIVLYLCFERALYNFSSPHRYKNIFCTPISQTEYGAFLNKLLTEEFLPNVRHWAKYTGFNLLPTRTLGTVEFRHMKGTLASELIVIWINIIQQLKIAAMDTTFEQLSKNIIALNTNSQYDMMAFQTFGNNARYIQNEHLHKQMEQDVLFVKETLLTHKKPKYDKNKFPRSTLGKFLLRKENLLDFSILDVDFSAYTKEELEQHKQRLAELRKKVVHTPTLDKIYEQYLKVERLQKIIFLKEEEERKAKKTVKPKAKGEF